MDKHRLISPDQPLYSMGVVERLTGLTARRIRYYEEVGLISPVRSKGNRRLYSEANVIRLRSIRQLMDRNASTETVRQLLDQ